MIINTNYMIHLHNTFSLPYLIVAVEASSHALLFYSFVENIVSHIEYTIIHTITKVHVINPIRNY